MIAIINYGLGNLHSVNKAVTFVGGETIVTDKPEEILKADKVILPGVGAFGDGMQELKVRGFMPVIKEAVDAGKLLLGICLGMQLLFDVSEEKGLHKGLGLLPGKVIFFTQTGIKIPQIGWNQVDVVKKSALMKGIQNSDYFYFNHGFYCVPQDEDDVLTETDYGLRYASSVERKNIYGVQFHPEKSQKTGMKILKNFVDL